MKYTGVIFGLFYIGHCVKTNSIYISKKDGLSISFFILSIVGFISYFVNDLYDTNYVFLDVFILTTISLVFYSLNEHELNVKYIFYIFVIISLLWFFQQINIYGLSSFDFNFFSNILFSSNSSLKYSVISYSFGLFFIYFLYLNDKVNLIISMSGLLLTSKRASLIALFCILVIFFIFKMQYFRIIKVLLTHTFVYSVVSVWIIFSLLIASDGFDDFIFSNFGVSADLLTMGRHTLYKSGLSMISDGIPVVNFYFASTYSVLTQLLDSTIYSNSEKILLHNEMLRLYIETGVVGLMFFLYFYFLFLNDEYIDLRRKVFLYSISMYMLILSFLDNILLYSVCWLVFSLVYSKKSFYPR
ncbi:O-antigen ligase family protein [Shewanella sp. 202IG2-18]|uniref:O-antigen ligase family protein n=1 Tax=Parashewanella hymeniacidonis TaxID=2807618 RepID=UPI001960EB0B|nr:O-antigen ligase family protein [Parashewanella hymeniacidonis]MBM7072033.1 O-antigen ligase family protein [Parashewanella hymeniacidonis]